MKSTRFRTILAAAPGVPTVNAVPAVPYPSRVVMTVQPNGGAAGVRVSPDPGDITIPGQAISIQSVTILPGTGPHAFDLPADQGLVTVATAGGIAVYASVALSEAVFDASDPSDVPDPSP